MDPYNFINFSNLAVIEEKYQLYLRNRSSLDPLWHAFFDGMSLSLSESEKKSPELLGTYLLIHAYRCYGHLSADCNPLIEKKEQLPEVLDPKRYGLNDPMMQVPSFGLFPSDSIPLQNLVQKLQEIYCSGIGFEFKGICSDAEENTLQQLIEQEQSRALTKSDKLFLYTCLLHAESFEVFLHTKYVGQKRFSLEGCETLIILLKEILEKGASLGMSKLVMGMAHRGRLNVLANIMKKDAREIFEEFSETYVPKNLEGSGDVKYHKGFKSSYATASNKTVEITLVDNPSHLESVGCVVEGIARALQESSSLQEVLPLLIHGDASLAGQGVVYETLQLANLQGYCTGGTIHLVVNNQIGFTSTPQETKSTLYCTDIAKAFASPVFHVNAYDVIACAKAAYLALVFRMKFQRDVFIDLIGYRKWGHNEGDEPFFTQPKLYKEIRSKSSILAHFHTLLLKEGIETSVLDTIQNEYLEALKEAHKRPLAQVVPASENPYPPLPALSLAQLQGLAEKITQIPPGFTPHPKVDKLFKERAAMAQNPKEKKLDWAFAELLSFAALLEKGISIRFSGEDSERGTFSQRHAVIVDQNTQEKFYPLATVGQKPTRFHIYNSPVSEFAVMGFEYGYSIAFQQGLVLWEAQYGDFANGAQIIIDQFLSSGKQKWGVNSNLTLLLPHGYEGAGPEHSSARMERYLELSAQKNMTLHCPTTPSQYFHLLQSQARMKTPCIVFTPKAMLRHPENLSSLQELVEKSYSPFRYQEEGALEQASALFLSVGKIFYTLSEAIRSQNRQGIFQVSIEQLYPFEEKAFQALLDKGSKIKKVLFIQEEPENMGALRTLAPKIASLLEKKKLPFAIVSRPESASPAAGSLYLHNQEHQALMEQVFHHVKDLL